MPNQYNLTNSKIFITGGAGFIANRLATVLADDNQIVLFDNLHNDAFSSSALSTSAPTMPSTTSSMYVKSRCGVPWP
jgi:nucleoside-diphosphate-sugar epimerase